jgi:DNA-binding protein YbaB
VVDEVEVEEDREVLEDMAYRLLDEAAHEYHSVMNKLVSHLHSHMQ